MIETPSPVFDNLNYWDKEQFHSRLVDHTYATDYQKAFEFIQCYKGSDATFTAYRREIERLLLWSSLIAQKGLRDLKRDDIETYVHFCQKPPKSWIGLYKVPRFLDEEDTRVPNPQWRPFIATVSKSHYKKGDRAKQKDFVFSQGSIKICFAIVSSFFNYLLQEDYVFTNPVLLIRQKSKFIRKIQGPPKIRRLSELQWQTVISCAQAMAEASPQVHERTLFIMSALYSMYLRISELAASKRWTPTMNHFYKDNEENWWFTTVGKGNKQRQIAVSNVMLEALKRWRKHLGFSTLPSPADQSTLLPKNKGQGPISDTSCIRRIVQKCFDQAIQELQNSGFTEEAETLTQATVHWLRHTGISEDVKHRPREHVRDDAGHGSGSITDRYIDVELRERHRSAKDKVLAL